MFTKCRPKLFISEFKKKRNSKESLTCTSPSFPDLVSNPASSPCCCWKIAECECCLLALYFLLQYTAKPFCWCASVSCWVGKPCPWTHVCSQQGCKTPSSSKNTEAVFVQPDSAYTTHPSGGCMTPHCAPFCSDFGRGEMLRWSQVCYSQDGLPPWPLSAREISTLYYLAQTRREDAAGGVLDHGGSGASTPHIGILPPNISVKCSCQM